MAARPRGPVRFQRVVASLSWVVSVGASACAPVPHSWRGPVPFEVGGPAPPPALHVQVEERFYPVSGRSPAALNLALLLQGPCRTGRVAHALTEWRLLWSYVPTPRGAVCALERPRVEVRIVTTLPRWLDVERAPSSLVSDWALFMARLRVHESGHQSIALRTGNELLSTLSGLEAGDCDQLMREARRRVARLARAHDADQRRFDRASDYGMAPEYP
jgi:predicted secreted Zn-dependent protease